jgi:uncharacterized protein (TIGR02646 family)
MKKVRKSLEPQGLKEYRLDSPRNTWVQFQDNAQNAYTSVQKQLFTDQRGLCAYCEHTLILTTENFPRDFRVEHFHPKETTDTNGHNWHLEWNNLLAVCHGGQQAIAGDNRYTHPDTSCDVPKGKKNLDGIILNPIFEIQISDRIFGFNAYTGEIFVNHTCPAELINKATKTIEELRLDAARLCRFRKVNIEQIQTEIMNCFQQGMNEEAAFTFIANSQFLSDAQEKLPAFFSSLRAYLGGIAEKRLVEIGFDG